MPSLQYTGSDLRRRERFILSPIFKTSFPYFFFFLPLKDMTHLHFPVLADQNLLIESKRNQLIVVTLNSSPLLFEYSAYGGLIDYM